MAVSVKIDGTKFKTKLKKLTKSIELELKDLMTVETFNAYAFMLDSGLIPDMRENWDDYSKAARSYIFAFWKNRGTSPPKQGNLYNVLESEQEESNKDITGSRGQYHIGIGNVKRLDSKFPMPREVLYINKKYKVGDAAYPVTSSLLGHGYWYYQWQGLNPEGPHLFFEEAYKYLDTHGNKVFNIFLNKLAGDWNIT